MKLEEDHQVISFSQTFPYISQNVNIASQGTILGCFVSEDNKIKIMTSQPSRYRSEFEDDHNVSYIRTFNMQGKLTDQSQLFGNITRFKIAKKTSLIIETKVHVVRHQDWFPTFYLGFKDTRQRSGIERVILIQERYRQTKVDYWTFPQSEIVCVLEREQQVRKRDFSVKISYYGGSRDLPLTAIATHGATYYDQEVMVSCHQLNGHSKMGWLSQTKDGKAIYYMLTLEQGSTKVQKLDVTINSHQNQTKSLWCPIWQIQHTSSTYLMAYMKLQDQQQFYEVINYCICTIQNGKIKLETRFSFPKKQENVSIRQEGGYMLEGGLFYLIYRKCLKETKSKIKHEGLLDLSRNSFTLLKDPADTKKMIYQNSSGKEVIVLEKKSQAIKNNRKDQKWTATVTVIFTHRNIKDVCMNFLLGLNEDFDDDLLCDTIGLLIE